MAQEPALVLEPIVAAGGRRSSSMRPARQARQCGVIARAVEDARVVRVWGRLEAEGLHPILIKGWATARYYRNPDARWLGDMDLCFSPDELPRALEVRRAFPREFRDTDYHEGVPDLPDRTWAEIFARTQTIKAPCGAIRVLAPEEHLRLTCRHLARHGACTRKMLQDVAAIVESLPSGFDWKECQRGDPFITQWMLMILALAQKLLGARLPDEIACAVPDCPKWLGRVVPRIWEAGRAKRPLGFYFRSPQEGWKTLWYRWLNPVRAAFYCESAPQSEVQMFATIARYFCLRKMRTLVSHPVQRLLRGGRRRPHSEVHQVLMS